MDNRVLSIVPRARRVRRIYNVPVFSLYRMCLVPGMFLWEDISLLLTGHMGVYLRRHNGTVTQQPLDVADINALLQQERGKRMPLWHNKDKLENPCGTSEYPQRDTMWYRGRRYGKIRICEKIRIFLADSYFVFWISAHRRFIVMGPPHFGQRATNSSRSLLGGVFIAVHHHMTIPPGQYSSNVWNGQTCHVR